MMTQHYPKTLKGYYHLKKLKTKPNAKGEEKKDYKGVLPAAWNKVGGNPKFLQDLEFKKDGKGTAVLTGSINNLTVIDFDKMVIYIKLTHMYPWLMETLIIKTRKGYHLYFEHVAELLNRDNVFEEYEGVDIRNDGGQVPGLHTTYPMLDGKIIEYKIEVDKPIKKLTAEQVTVLVGMLKPKKPKPPPKAKSPNASNVDLDELEQVAGLITIKHLDDRTDWLKIVMACASSGLYDLSVKLSSKSDKFEQAEHDALYHSYTDRNITVGTLHHYAKLSQPEAYYKLLKYPPLTGTDGNLCEIFMRLFSENLVLKVLKDELELYMYHNQQWRMDNKRHTLLKKLIRVELTKYVGDRIHAVRQQLITMDEDEVAKLNEVLKAYQKVELKVMSKKVIDNVSDFVIQDLSDDDFSHIEFDINKDQLFNLNFRNGLYELETKVFRPRHKKDYVTKFLDWDYSDQCDQAKMDKVLDFYHKIQPDPVQRKFSIGWMAQCLNGSTAREEFKVNVGQGSNGKTTEFSIHAMVFPIYSFTLSDKTFEKGFDKRHKQIIHLVKGPIRFAAVEELPKTKLDEGFLKQIVTGKGINCEIMYGTSVKRNTQAKIATCSNNDINIDGDDAVFRRALQQQYNSTFKDDVDDDPEKHIYRKDRDLDNLFNNDEYKLAYLHVLLDHYDDYSAPKLNRDLFKETAQQYDEFAMLLEQHYEVTKNPDDLVSKQDFHTTMKQSKNMSWRTVLTEAKRMGLEYNKNKMRDGVRGVFVGLVPREEEEEEGDDYSKHL